MRIPVGRRSRASKLYGSRARRVLTNLTASSVNIRFDGYRFYDCRHVEREMSESIVAIATTSVDLEPCQIPIDWILAGMPDTRNASLAKSADGGSRIVVWECTAGHFNWRYGEDETAIIISGEVFISTNKGKENRLGQGDVGFFPAGSSCIWRVPERVKKVAILRKNLPLPLSVAMRAWYKLRRPFEQRGVRPL
jgi:uncharacterized protein